MIATTWNKMINRITDNTLNCFQVQSQVNSPTEQ